VATNPASIGVGDKAFQPDAWTGAWSPMIKGATANPMGVDLFAMVFGLGFVLAFGYWCTNFLVVQRAMAAKDMSAARRTPLIGAIPKMLIPALVILPGMIAAGLAFSNKDNKDGYRLPPKVIAESAYVNVVAAVKHVAATGVTGEAAVQEIAKAAGLKMMSDKVAEIIKDVPNMSDLVIKARVQNAVAENDYDGVILSLIKRYCPTGLLGLALTALLASFMSGMAGNVTAFNTIWTYDLYQAYLGKGKTDAHYMWMGRVATVAGILISIGCAYFAAMYNNAMDVIQLVFGFVNAPLFATFLLGMFWKRITATGAFWGLLLGTTTSAIFHSLTLAIGNAPGVKGGYLGVVQSFPSEMAQNFWLASFAFLTCLALTTVLSLATKQNKTDAELTGLVYSLTPRIHQADEAWYMRPGVQAVALLAVCLVLNIIFW
jgi:SSS family solute:Na+ symporter